jgi:pyrroline-5-carboxylate reductase
MERTTTPLVLIGGGNMAQAIVRGGIDAGLLTPALLAVVEPEPGKRDVFRTWGVRAFKGADELPAWLEAVERTHARAQLLLAIKPQVLGDAAGPLIRALGGGRTRRVVISILAGMPTVKVGEMLGASAVVRAMPNMAASARKSTTAIALGTGVEEGEETLAVQLFESIGRVVRIDEFLMDAFTAVAGSGPAYVFYLAEAMARAAEQLGFDRDTAEWMARWTVAGAGTLLDGADQPPETLRAAVTSKGGTTAAAMSVLDGEGVMDAFVRAITAARDRGRELSRHAGS